MTLSQGFAAAAPKLDATASTSLSDTFARFTEDGNRLDPKYVGPVVGPSLAPYYTEISDDEAARIRRRASWWGRLMLRA